MRSKNRVLIGLIVVIGILSEASAQAARGPSLDDKSKIILKTKTPSPSDRDFSDAMKRMADRHPSARRRNPYLSPRIQRATPDYTTDYGN